MRAPIDRRTHVAWLAARLAAPTCRIWIGSTGGVPSGVVRFEIDADGRAVVSIAVDAAARGHGIGRVLLRQGLDAARAELRHAGFRAWVRADNAASIALFGSAGFAPSAAIPPAAPDAPLELLLDER
jgi:[ribosomal protein S18]-alanine N-acetyltransferase